MSLVPVTLRNTWTCRMSFPRSFGALEIGTYWPDGEPSPRLELREVNHDGSTRAVVRIKPDEAHRAVYGVRECANIVAGVEPKGPDPVLLAPIKRAKKREEK